jgi:hypothetical protein
MERVVPVAPLLDADLVSRKVVVRDQDVVFVKGIFEASEGLGALFAERGGELTISAPLSRARELDELLADLQVEIQAEVSTLSEASLDAPNAVQLTGDEPLPAVRR